jgi:C-terminal processing protease CtpA/Prc
MKKVLLFFSAVALLSSCGQKQDLNPNNRLAKDVSLYNPQDVKNLIASQKLSREQVMNSMHAMRQSFAETYIGYNVKKDLIGISGDEIFANCAKMVPEKDSFSSLEYYDLVRKCVAQFKDSHIGVPIHMSPAVLETAIGMAELADGKVFISRTREQITKKIEEIQKLPAGSLAAVIKPGAEIVKVDGKPVLDAVKELEAYVGGSSDAARTREAVSDLFVRNYSYPASQELQVTIRTDDGTTRDLTIPWVIYAPNSSLESRILLSDRGFLNSADLSEESAFSDSSGFRTAVPLFRNLTNPKTYIDSDENPLLVTGLINKDGKNICYMQVNSFSVKATDDYGYKAFTLVGETKQPVNLLNAEKEFLRNCDAFKSPLLLDLRENGGGNAYYADKFFRLFEKSDTPVSYRAEADYMSAGNFALLDLTFEKADKQATALEESLTLAALTNAIKQNRKIGDWVLTRESTDLSSFDDPIVLATSYNCVSACEFVTHRFQNTQRAKIAGSPTAGTGFGFSSTGDFKIGYHDVLNLIDVKIPNHAFSSTVVADDSQFITESAGKGNILDLTKLPYIENHPAVPDVTIQYTRTDITHNFADYRTTILQLFGN